MLNLINNRNNYFRDFLGVRLIKVSFKVNKGNKFQVSLYSDPGGTLEKIKQPETLI